MDREYWQQQTASQPLFKDLLWSRPENRAHAGKLLIVGGNAHGFAAPAEAYRYATEAGVGLTRVLLPQSVKSLLPSGAPDMEFVPSTPSGSFARLSVADFIDAAAWADGVLLAGDFGRNSETAIVLESLVWKYHGLLTLAGDAVDYFTGSATMLDRPSTVLVVDLAQLQKLATAAKFTTAFTSTLDLLHLVEALHDFSADHQAALVLVHDDTIFVAVDGQVSTTKPSAAPLKIAASASVWHLQNPTKPFEALTTSLILDN